MLTAAIETGQRCGHLGRGEIPITGGPRGSVRLVAATRRVTAGGVHLAYEVAGIPDSHIPQDKLAAVAARIPRCKLPTIPAGHHVHAARPAEFADVVLDWLRS